MRLSYVKHTAQKYTVITVLCNCAIYWGNFVIIDEKILLSLYSKKDKKQGSVFFYLFKSCAITIREQHDCEITKTLIINNAQITLDVVHQMNDFSGLYCQRLSSASSKMIQEPWPFYRYFASSLQN